MSEKNAQENEFRQQELDLKRQEMQDFQTLMKNQQQETNLNVAFLNILGMFLPPQNSFRLNQVACLHFDNR